MSSKLHRTKTPEKWASLVTTTYAKVSLPTACVLWLCSSFGRWWAPLVFRGAGDPIMSPDSLRGWRLTPPSHHSPMSLGLNNLIQVHSPSQDGILAGLGSSVHWSLLVGSIWALAFGQKKASPAAGP